MTGKELKKYRKQKGWTQEELASQAGVTKRTIINYENSDEIPKSKANIFHFIFLDVHLDSENISNEPKLTPEEKLRKNTSAENLKVNEPSQIYPTKSGSIIEELPNGKFLLTVPMVPYKAHATYISEFTDADFIQDLTKVSFIVDRVPRGKYQAFEIINDSMNDATLDRPPSRDAILSGDIVLGRELGKQHWSSKLNINGYPYWIIVTHHNIICKEIIDHDIKKGIITCHSLNNSPEFRDFEIRLDECHQLFNIIKKQV